MPDYIYLLQNRLSPAQQNALIQVRHAARAHGMTVFLTGGAVRDLATGLPVRDLDFSVHGNALKLKKSLEKAGLELWGEHEPTRTLFFWLNGVRIEVSSTRTEEYLKPGKLVYHWATILDDLRRRDFTANAMGISLNDGSYGLLLDPLNGIADVEARLLRLVSNYGFAEDPSRLLRAVRFQARTGWDLEERTKVRYQNAKESGYIDAISPYLAGYELEEIGHEEDGLKTLKALEAEGWTKHICPTWTSAKADVPGLEALHQTLIQFLIQGIHPDISAAQMELLTAKMPPKDLAALKKRFPRPGFVSYWKVLDDAAKEFQKELLDKKNAAPSATWKLLTTYAPEPILWLAYTSKNSQVQSKFKNFFTVWPETRQKIPTALMLEMRIVPQMPGYQELVQEIFYQLMDEKLQTEEEMRAFLEPHSPPAPPPPVKISRSRKRGESRFKLRDEEEEEVAEPSEDEEELPIRGHLLDEESVSAADADLESDEEEEEEATEATPVSRGKAAKAAPARAEPMAENKAHKAPPLTSASAKKPPAKAAEPAPPPKKAASHVAASKAPTLKSAPETVKAAARHPAKTAHKSPKHALRLSKKPTLKPMKKADAKPVKKKH